MISGVSWSLPLSTIVVTVVEGGVWAATLIVEGGVWAVTLDVEGGVWAVILDVEDGVWAVTWVVEGGIWAATVVVKLDTGWRVVVATIVYKQNIKNVTILFYT